MTSMPPPSPESTILGHPMELENNFLNLLLCTKYRGQSWFQSFIKLYTIAIHLARKLCLTQLYKLKKKTTKTCSRDQDQYFNSLIIAGAGHRTINIFIV